MTQLALGLDGIPAVIAKLFDERDDAVKALMSLAIFKACKRQGKYVGICGQGPSEPSGTALWAGGTGHRQSFLEPRHCGRDLDVPCRRYTGMRSR